MSDQVEQCVLDFQSAKTKADLFAQQLAEKQDLIKTKKQRVEDLIKARWVLTEVQKITQSKFKERVESLVTLAIRSVFGPVYKFVLEFERKRNKLECTPVVMEGQDRYSPKDDEGGSLVDIIALAFRIVLLSLEKPKSRPTIFLDEPMKNMGDMIDLGGKVLREISHKLKFQLIIITHSKELMAIGDRVYEVIHQRPRHPWSIVSLLTESVKRLHRRK